MTETKYAALSFADGADLWSIPETGDYAADNAAGRAAAADLVRVMFFSDAPFLLGHVVKAMIAKGRFGAVEIGFCHAIAEQVQQA